jgi:hypothetical protein
MSNFSLNFAMRWSASHFCTSSGFTRHRFFPIDPERVSDLVETRSSVKGALSYLDDDGTALPVRENPLDSKNVRLVAFATRDTRYAGKSLSERLCIAGA